MPRLRLLSLPENRLPADRHISPTTRRPRPSPIHCAGRQILKSSRTTRTGRDDGRRRSYERRRVATSKANGWRASLSQRYLAIMGARAQGAGGANTPRGVRIDGEDRRPTSRIAHDVALTGRRDWTGNRRVIVQRQVNPGLFVEEP
jgi:hypothetical protein